ncbi:tetratricopeptide repeat protein [Poritiphilus flavus]|uniref:Tetratricopeptide repeat protein n=1 Tax=Poritiphilus flavus TaxID=2697053 RepID=A0A6L9EGD0_9FLAO|nr:tetratricopeptide repeat protein [Poritiphilus flavus]NAS13751.1 tetratricopeptide repeat protein [Poritiphilus flavus]
MKALTALFCCATLLVVTIPMTAQKNQKIDSLLEVYANQPEGIEKVKTLSTLFTTFLYQDPDLAKKYAEEMLSLSRKINYDRGEALGLYHIGVCFTNSNNVDSARTYYRQSLKLQEKVKDEKTRANALDGLAILAYDQGNYDEALELLDETLAFFKTTPVDSSSLASTHSFRASIYINQGKFNIALKECMAALDIYNKFDDEIRKADALGVLASIESSLNNFENSIKYNKEALEIYEANNDLYYSAQALNDIGNVHYYLKEYREALEHFERSLEHSEEINAKALQATTLGNMGKVYSENNQTDKALTCFTKGLKIVQQLEYRFKECEILNDMGIAYSKDNQPDNAIPLFDKAIAIANEIQSPRNLEISYYQKSLAFAKLNQPVLELDNYKAYTKIHDSILNLEKSKQIEELRTIYDTERKEQQIVLQENEIELLGQQAEISKLQKLLLGGGLGLSLLVIGFGFYGYRQKIKRSQLEREKLDAELAFKKKELTTHALHLAKKNEVLEGLKQKAKALKASEGSGQGYQQLIQTINFDQHDDKNWESFTRYFEQVHKDFAGNVKTRYPEVTKNELRFMALIKMNMSSKEIANILNISLAGVKKARNRLRKKLDITPEESLEALIISI